MHTPSALVGQKLGSWTVSRLLAKGGMAEVYLGVQPSIGAEVAIKVMSVECAGDRDLIERFFGEARAVNKIRHERIVSILDLSLLGDGRPYVVMERLHGASLARLMEAGPLPLGALVGLALEILDALSAAHAAGVIHRDLKPDNIFVTPSGHAKLLDFGVAKLLTPELRGALPRTAIGTILGTPRYMSPEQASSGTVGPASDLYALGVLLYEAVTGAPLFTADSHEQMIEKHLRQPPEPPSVKCGNMPQGLEAVILRALAKSPADRFASAAQMSLALAQLSIPAGPPLAVPPEDEDEEDDRPPLTFDDETVRAQPAADRLIGRYQVRALIGEGGVGQVFRAWDPQLKREVALKLLRLADPSLAQRMLSEAQAHARIDHPRVCRIYEVGEAGGKPYIAMQLIEGRPLSEAAAGMDRRARLAVLRDVAEALQAVHDLGLVHRDVKPSNIMVGENGTAYLLDFGLAREIGAAGLTATGAVLGTPEYMSPEQARGDVRALDHRADIYGLGATLYEMILGRPPFSADTTAQVVYQILHQEPPAPRTLDPGVSTDLETVVMRCLEKEPERRFVSAKGLAADLGRILAGEPIVARPPTLRERALKLVRRHRLATIAGSLTLLFAVALAGLALEARRRSSLAADAAQRFGREAGRIESFMRDARLLPLHDVRPEKVQVQVRIAALEQQLGKVGPAARPAGHYAIGRGWLALNELERAETELERAWQGGLHDADVAYALGRTLAARYFRALNEANHATSEKLQKELAQKAQARFRDPAVRYARLALAQPQEAPEYIEGLIAYTEDRLDDALALAEQARTAEPNSPEAAQLAGDVLLERGFVKFGHGDASALADIEAAGVPFAAAIAIARSDALLYTRECNRLSELMRLRFAAGTPVDSIWPEAHTACENARTAEPGMTEAYTDEIDALRPLADQVTQHGGDPRPLVAEGLPLAEATLRIDPRNLNALSAIAVLYMTRSDYELARGIDPTESFTRAADAIEKGLAIDPRDADQWYELGNILGTRGAWIWSRGGDAGADMTRSIDAYEKSVALEPHNFQSLGNEASSALFMADWQLEHGHDPSAVLQQARRACERALALSATDHHSLQNLGNVYNDQAAWLMGNGHDPTSVLDESERAIDRALAANREFSYSWVTRAESASLRLRWMTLHGGEHAAVVERGRAAVARAIEIDPVEPVVATTGARLELETARVLRSVHRDADAALVASVAHAQKALAINPEWEDVRPYLAEAHRLRGEILVEKRRSPAAELAAGIESAEHTLKTRPDHARALAARAGLELLAARSDPRRAGHAVELYEQALKSNPLLAAETAADRAAAKTLAR